jgi:hypothetical protein
VWPGRAGAAAAPRHTAAEAIVQDPNLHRDRSLRVELEAVDPDKGDQYRTHIWLEGDPGEVGEYRGEATLKEGVLSFAIKADDGTTLTFVGEVPGNTDLEGTFSATAWAVVKDALSGSWELARQAP